MLKRALLILLTLCLAWPAAFMAPAAAQTMPAAMTAMPMATMVHDHHRTMPGDTPQDSADHMGKHQCIGCAVPVGLGGPQIAAPVMGMIVLHPARTQRLGHTRDGPDTPPPRA